jgi:hypothetical protein
VYFSSIYQIIHCEILKKHDVGKLTHWRPVEIKYQSNSRDEESIYAYLLPTDDD